MDNKTPYLIKISRNTDKSFNIKLNRFSGLDNSSIFETNSLGLPSLSEIFETALEEQGTSINEFSFQAGKDNKLKKINKDSYLIFTLNNIRYSIGINNVIEVVEFQDASIIAKTGDTLLMEIEFRKAKFPLINLRQMFGKAETCRHETIILLGKMKGENIFYYGILVDKILEINEIQPDQITLCPVRKCNSSVILGSYKQNKMDIEIIDVDKLFGLKWIHSFSSL